MNGSSNESGVSPVVGVILVVAITVLLSAAIGAFVLNIGQQSTTPEQSELGIKTGTNGSNITAQIVTGEADHIELRVNGTVVDSQSNPSPGDILEGPATRESTVSIVTGTASPTVVSTSNPFEGSSSGTVKSGPIAPTDGLIANYPLETGATDTVGGVDGTLDGASVVDDAQRGNVIAFDGQDDVITGTVQGVGAPATFSVWVKKNDSTDDFSAIVSDDSSSGYSGIQLEATNNKFSIRLGNGGSTDSWNRLSYYSESGAFENGKWYHFVGVIESASDSGVTMYVNGEQEPIASVTGGANSIGYTDGGGEFGQNSASDAHFGGNVSDVHIYDRALDESEVKQLYNATKE